MNFYISAAHKSSGKTTLSIGLSAALAESNTIQTFKKGPDYIDPIWLKQASENPCFNLDFYTMSANEITDKFNQHAVDFRLIEGNKGLYDGLDKKGTDSNAALANLLKTPVILVVDCTGITRGIAPLLLGYQQFNQPNVNISGVILNKIGGARHESKLIAAVEHYTDIPVIGAIHKNPEINIDERHLGLIPSNEFSETEALIKKIKTVVQSSINLEFFKPSPFKNTLPAHHKKLFNLTIAVAKDAAFGFYYDDDLQDFENFGATIVYFSPLNDKKLPDNIDGLFLGGGFPETSANQLSENQSLLKDLNQKITNGLPTYAECGGLMILTNRIIDDNQAYPMAKIINADCVMQKKTTRQRLCEHHANR